MNKITILIKHPGEQPEVKEIDNTYEGMREALGGRLEHFASPRPYVRMLVDEEGVLKDLEPNIALPEYNTILVGPVIVFRIRGENAVSLTPGDIKWAKLYLDKRSI